MNGAKHVERTGRPQPLPRRFCLLRLSNVRETVQVDDDQKDGEQEPQME